MIQIQWFLLMDKGILNGEGGRCTLGGDNNLEEARSTQSNPGPNDEAVAYAFTSDAHFLLI